MGRVQTADGIHLAFEDSGIGHPLVCLPGLTRNMADFDPVAARFGGEARIIRLDSRGRGQSDHAPHATYTLQQESADVLSLLDHLGLMQVTILGTSRGGLIAMGLAATHPHRVGGAILVDIGPVIDPAGLDAIMTHLGRPPVYRSYEDAADRMAEDRAPRFANVPRETWRILAERFWTETGDGLALRYDPRLRDAVIEQTTNLVPPDLWPLFDALATKPLGLIRGANSDLLSPETTAEMQRRAPDMLTAEVPDRGHVPFLDEPESLALIEAYLERVS